MKLQVMELESRDCPSIWTASNGIVREYSDSGALIRQFEPFGSDWKGGMDVSVRGNLVGVSAGEGGSPHVKMYGFDGQTLREHVSLYAYAPVFHGGVNLELTESGFVTGTGSGGGLHVKQFDRQGKLINQFFAGNPDSRDGVQVTISREGVIPSPVSPVLNFRPQANEQIFLDFASITDPQRISQIYQYVASLFAPYDVNVTTSRPNKPLDQIAHVVISNVPIQGQPHAVGVAIVNGFYEQHQLETHPASVVSDGLSDIKLARAIAHETGHLFGFEHVTDTRSVMFKTLLSGLGIWDPSSDLLLALRLGRI